MTYRYLVRLVLIAAIIGAVLVLAGLILYANHPYHRPLGWSRPLI